MTRQPSNEFIQLVLTITSPCSRLEKTLYFSVRRAKSSDLLWLFLPPTFSFNRTATRDFPIFLNYTTTVLFLQRKKQKPKSSTTLSCEVKKLVNGECGDARGAHSEASQQAMQDQESTNVAMHVTHRYETNPRGTPFEFSDGFTVRPKHPTTYHCCTAIIISYNYHLLLLHHCKLPTAYHAIH